jgi:two-component system, OmpR family, sensor kinase
MTLWNVAIIAFALVVSGAIWYSVNRVRAKEDLDHRLVMDLKGIADGPPPPPRRDDGEFPGGPGDRPPPNEGFRPDQEADAVAAIRRPRFFDSRGKSINGRRDIPLDPQALRRALGGRGGLSSVEFDGEVIRVATVPWRDGGAVQLGHETDEFDRAARAQLGTLGIVLPVALLISAGGALLLTLQVLRPLRRTTSAVSRISLTDLKEQVPVTSNDEFGELATAFNAMLARIEQAHGAEQRAFAQMAETLEQQRQFTADVSHELRTPLTRIRLAVDQPDGEKVIRAATAQMSRMVDQLLTLARADAGELPLNRENLDIRVVVAEALSQVGVGDRTIGFESPDAPLIASVDADYLQRIVVNLTENAVRHTADEGTINWRMGRGAAIWLEIEDDGVGIAPEHLANIWNRFYRADEARHRSNGGAGLGLAIVKSLVEAHGGSVSVRSQVGKGTAVRIELPA